MAASSDVGGAAVDDNDVGGDDDDGVDGHRACDSPIAFSGTRVPGSRSGAGEGVKAHQVRNAVEDILRTAAVRLVQWIGAPVVSGRGRAGETLSLKCSVEGAIGCAIETDLEVRLGRPVSVSVGTGADGVAIMSVHVTQVPYPRTNLGYMLLWLAAMALSVVLGGALMMFWLRFSSTLMP